MLSGRHRPLASGGIVLVIVQARMGSTRLPGKVLRDLGGRPVLGWVLRAAAAAAVGDVVVATTHLAEDDPVAHLAEDHGVACVRGEPDDVLRRFAQVLDQHGDAPFVRLTADCPLVDPQVVAAAAAAFSSARVDYASTVQPRSLPRGLDVQVASARALRAADREADGYHRAHVLSWVAERPDRFPALHLQFAPAAPDFRVTLDTPDDARALDALVGELGEGPHGWQRIVATLQARSDIASINSSVAQKPLEAG